MKIETFTQQVNIPSIEEFADKYPHYGNHARDEYNFLFEEIMSPESFIFLSVTTHLDLPAVAGIAEKCYRLVERNGAVEWRGFIKQFIGAAVCVLMESNGFKKTGIKKSVPHSKYTKAEFYEIS